MEIPKIDRLVGDSKHVYTLKDDDKTLVKVTLKATLETDHKMINISQGHKNICPINKCVYDGITYYVYIERLYGNDLFEHMNKNRMNSEIIMDIVVQILEGLQYLHKNGIIHGDVKLENTFMCGDGTVKLIDFGLSKWINVLDIKCGGSYPYISPEMLLSKNSLKINEKSDIWSLGIMIYTLVEGKYPFIQDIEYGKRRETLVQKLSDIKLAETEDDYNFEKIMGIDKRIWDPILLDMVKKMIIYDPDKRISVDEILDMAYQETVDI